MKPDHPERRRLERELLAWTVALILARAVLGLVDPDLAGHVAYGLQHLASGELATRDPYAYSVQAAPWTNHEWLFELGVAWIYTYLGPAGLVALQAAVWGAIGVLVMASVRRHSRILVPSVLLFTLAALVSLKGITVRPQMFTCLCFALLLLALETGRRGVPWAWLLAGALLLPWVNLHGGFLAGLGVFALYVLGHGLDLWLKREEHPPGDPRPTAVRRCLPAGLGLGLAGGLTLVNPDGVGLYRFLVRSLGRPRPHITEWAPLDPLSLDGVTFGVALAVGLALCWRSRRTLPLSHALVLLVTAVLGARHVRHQPFFGLALAAFLGGPADAAYRGRVPAPAEDVPAHQRRRLAWTVRLVIPLALALSLWPNRARLFALPLSSTAPVAYPTGALAYLDRHQARGNILVHFDWAQLVLARYHHRLRVFFDGRFRTVYPPRVEADYWALHFFHEGWRRALDDYPTELVLLPAKAAAAQALSEDPGWRWLYRDRYAVLLVRRQHPAAALPQEEGAEPLPVLPFELAGPKD